MKEPSGPDPLVPPDAEIRLWTGHPSLWSFSGWLFLCAILFFAAGAGLIPAAAILLYRQSRRYTVTNRRVLAETGLFRRRRKEIPLCRIERIETVYPSLPIAPGVGDLIVSAGADTLRMDSVPDCGAVRSLMERRMAECPDPSGSRCRRSPE